jgi:hypothetical protein
MASKKTNEVAGDVLSDRRAEVTISLATDASFAGSFGGRNGSVGMTRTS